MFNNPLFNEALFNGLISDLAEDTQAIWEASFYSTPILINRVYAVGQDGNGNPVFGEATDSETPEILRIYTDSMITSETDAESVATNILAKARLNANRGQILITPNVGTELWDVVNVNDTSCNQSDAKYRVAGWSFVYRNLQNQEAKYEVNLKLTAR